ncbi:MAG: Mov34/MPN/PAD-1 family protein [Candidatus Helarchaeota archaeon]
MRILINPMAFYNILEHSSKDLKKEVAGYLIGKVKTNKLYISNTDTAHQKATSIHVQLNDLEMVKVAEKLEKRGAKEHIIGWYHSHPRLGAHFYSHTDINTQIRYQQLFPEAVGLVIDPAKFKATSRFSDIDCHLYHLKGEKLQNIKLNINKRLLNGLTRIYSRLKDMPQNVREFINNFEKFLDTELESVVYANYYGNNFRTNYQITPFKVWSHIYTKNYGKFHKYDLVFKGFFKGACKRMEKKFDKIGFKARATKDAYSNYYLVILNIENAKFTEKLAVLLKELYKNWKQNLKK